MSLLVQLMRYYDGDSNDKKRALESIEDKRIKKLLLAEELDSGVLIQKEVYKTIHEAMKPARVMRDALPTINTNKLYLRYPVVDDGVVYAPEVPEATEIPMAKGEQLKYIEFKIRKYGVRPVITREMVEDAEYDVIERCLRQAGEQLENGLNKAALEMLISDADPNNDVKASGEMASISDVADSIYKIKRHKYLPDTMVVSPIAEAELLKDSRMLMSIVPNETLVRSGDIGTRILGLKMLSTNIDAENALFNWGGNKSQDPIAVIYDYSEAGMIVMREELRIERYSDPIRDLVGMTATMRYDVGSIHPESISRLEHS